MIVRLSGKKSRINIMSAITNQGKMRFMMYRDTMTCDLLIKFIVRLTTDAGHKVFLILDNIRSHHGKTVKNWLEEHREEMEIFYLPSYRQNSIR